MYTEKFNTGRAVQNVEQDFDFCIVGGGFAGTCAAITAAREGLRVVLFQARPVLGGNASSEVRLWALGATAHMHNNNRFAREGGVVDEILVENLHRNREGNPLFLDALLLEKVAAEPNITLYLNTVVYDVVMSGPNRIGGVVGFNPQNETRYSVSARLYCDASGDGLLAYLAGVPFRFGAENSEEFGEEFAPDRDQYGELLGHSIFFYTKDTGAPVRYVAPAFALKDVQNRIPRFRDFNVNDQGCRFWWLEYGGRLDTIHDSETIKWELWKIVYGVWDYIKNSGNFPESENMTLEWIGLIPGKRESRRFEGAGMLVQSDLVTQRHFEDVVSYGGWSIDLHPADGIYAARKGCDQYHIKGIYGIPYRTMYNPKVNNLFLAGRVISVSHVAFGSTRVMVTCAQNAQAVAMAAAMCVRRDKRPADIAAAALMKELQIRLVRAGQRIPFLLLEDPEDLAELSRVSSSGSLRMSKLRAAPGRWIRLSSDTAVLLPFPSGRLPRISFTVEYDADFVPANTAESAPGGASSARSVQLRDRGSEGSNPVLRARLKTAAMRGNFTPDNELAVIDVPVVPDGSGELDLDFNCMIEEGQYCFVCFDGDPRIRIAATETRVPAVVLLRHTHDQEPPVDSGIPGFELWLPERRPDGFLPALRLDPDPALFGPEQVKSGYQRPFFQSNCWVPALDEREPEITLEWNRPVTLAEVHIVFDTDPDHAMESVLRGHPESDMPFCVRSYEVRNEKGDVIASESDNFQTLRRIQFTRPCVTSRLTIRILSTWGDSPGAIYDVRCYESVTSPFHDLIV